jgi:hypothetical protein
MYVASDFRTVDAGEFRSLANRQLPAGSSEADVLAFMERVVADPPEKATALSDRHAEPASEFNKGTGCRFNGDCVLAHVDQSAPVLFLRLDNTRGGVFPCDGGGVFAWFVLGAENRLQEIVTEDFSTCL